MSVHSSPPRSYPSPRIELEEAPAPRLGAESQVAVVPMERDPGAIASPGIPWVAGGAGVLIAGLAVLQAVNFIAAQFARSELLGGVTLAVVVIGFGSIGAGIWRELRALISLRTVDHLRAELSGPAVARARPALRRWLSRLPEGQAAIDAIETMEDPAAVLALLRAGPVATLRAQSEALGRVAAVQIFAAAAAVPSPAFDGLLIAWRGIRLVRQVAALHGLRPGLFGTLALLRRAMLAAAGVMAADLAIDTLSRAVLSSPLLAHVVGDVAGAGIAARRMIVLARATAAACSPVPPG